MIDLTYSQATALAILRNAHLDNPDQAWPLHGPTSPAHLSSLRALCRLGLAQCSLGVYFRLVGGAA
jgi:hypothetical protein